MGIARITLIVPKTKDNVYNFDFLPRSVLEAIDQISNKRRVRAKSKCRAIIDITEIVTQP